MVTKALRYKSPPLGRIGRPVSGWTWSVGFDPLVFDDHVGKEFLLVCYPKDVNARAVHGPYGPVGMKPSLHWNSHGGAVTIYPGATIDRSSEPTDTPANEPIESRILPTFNFNRETFSGVNPNETSNKGEGVVELTDPANELSYLFSYVWDQARIEIKSGQKTQRFEDWSTVGVFTAKDVIGSAAYKTILLYSISWQLEAPLHDNYYKGTGGLEGDERLKGQWKPYTVGWCKNVEPVMVDSARKIYQWSFTSSQAVMAFKHAGNALDFHADYATYDELVDAIDNNEIPSSEYATCLAASCAFANITIEKGIRVDVKGDFDITYGFGGPTTRADIVRRLATAYGKNRLTVDQIDNANFSKFNLRHSAVCGYHWQSQITKAAAIKEVLEGVLGYFYFRPDSGKLAIGYARNPNTEGSIATLAFGDEGMSTAVMIARSIPRAGTRVGYQRNYAPQDRNDLAGVILDDNESVEILKAESQYGVHEMPFIRVRYPSSVVVTVNGGFWNKIDAEAEAVRQQLLLSVPRAQYRWTMYINPNIDLLDRIITVTDGENMLDLGSSKPLLCTGIDSRGRSQITTTWWG
jgi:hypothetical protein